MFEEWARHDVGDVFVSMFDTALAHWMGMDQVGLCVHARTCGDAVALEHSGDLYSCDHYVEPGYLLGNIGPGGRALLELVDLPQQRAFGQAKLDTLPSYCRSCEVRFACNGGCPKDRFTLTPDGEPGLHYLCAGIRFFTHVDGPMRVMAAQLQQGRDATGLRDWYAARDTRRAPGAPCPCGRPLPFTSCHGAPGTTPGAP